MRKLIPALIAAAALVAAAPAAADNASATVSHDGNTVTCTTPDSPGVEGQYGADGYFVDGCTAAATCQASTCDVRTASEFVAMTSVHVTMNSRLRTKAGHSDNTCQGTGRCTIADGAAIERGESASVQCNGVYKSEDRLLSHVSCAITVTPLGGEPAAPADTPPAEQPCDCGAGPGPSAPAQGGRAYDDAGGYDFDAALAGSSAAGASYGSYGSYGAEQADESGPRMVMQFRGLKKRVATVRLTCPTDEESCMGRIAVRLGTKTMTSAAFPGMAGGETKTVRIKLSAAKNRKVLRAGVLQLKATATDAAGNSTVRGGDVGTYSGGVTSS